MLRYDVVITIGAKPSSDRADARRVWPISSVASESSSRRSHSPRTISTHTYTLHDLLHGAGSIPRHAPTAEIGAINDISKTRTASVEP